MRGAGGPRARALAAHQAVALARLAPAERQLRHAGQLGAGHRDGSHLPLGGDARPHQGHQGNQLHLGQRLGTDRRGAGQTHEHRRRPLRGLYHHPPDVAGPAGGDELPAPADEPAGRQGGAPLHELHAERRRRAHRHPTPRREPNQAPAERHTGHLPRRRERRHADGMAAGIRQPSAAGVRHRCRGYPNRHPALLPKGIPRHGEYRASGRRQFRPALDTPRLGAPDGRRRVRRRADSRARPERPPDSLRPPREGHPAGRGAPKLLPHQRAELHLSLPPSRRDRQPTAAGASRQGGDGAHPRPAAARLRDSHELRRHRVHPRGAGQNLRPHGADHPHPPALRAAHHPRRALPVPHRDQPDHQPVRGRHLLLPARAGAAALLAGGHHHLAQPGHRQHDCHDRPHPLPRRPQGVRLHPGGHADHDRRPGHHLLPRRAHPAEPAGLRRRGHHQPRRLAAHRPLPRARLVGEDAAPRPAPGESAQGRTARRPKREAPGPTAPPPPRRLAEAIPRIFLPLLRRANPLPTPPADVGMRAPDARVRPAGLPPAGEDRAGQGRRADRHRLALD